MKNKRETLLLFSLCQMPRGPPLPEAPLPSLLLFFSECVLLFLLFLLLLLLSLPGPVCIQGKEGRLPARTHPAIQGKVIKNCKISKE